jgi:hypothetical protein
MPFIGNKPSAVPLTSADIADGIITSAKITDATIVNGDIANSTIALSKLSTTGTADATTFLRGDGAYTAVSSDYVLLGTSTITSNVSSISIDGYFSSTYTSYKVIFYGVFGSTIQLMNVRFNRSGSAITTSNYIYAGIQSYASVPENSIGTFTELNVSAGLIAYYTSAVDKSLSGFLEINNPLSTTAYKSAIIFANSLYGGNTNFDTRYHQMGVVLKDSTSALSGFTFLPNSGTLNGGTFKIYGIK